MQADRLCNARRLYATERMVLIMKYLVLIPDGMADEPIAELSGKTPMQAADKPTMDKLAAMSRVGTVLNVPAGMVPESDTANMAILSFDPKVYSKGRSPLEAVSMGIDMKPGDVAVRCNTVTLSDEIPGQPYEERVMLDHSADEISTEEADALIKTLNENLADESRHFYTGVSYRHCLIWNGADDSYDFARPHNIIGQKIGEYLPDKKLAGGYRKLMEKGTKLLEHHPINEARRARGLKPANAIWLWSAGKKPALPSFRDKFGLDATVVSAVDLIKGIGLCAGMNVVNVEGATGNIHTNFKGKADAAIDAFKNGSDLVYVHVEAPDECGHRAETENKVLSIELIDKKILAPVLEYLESCGDDFGVMVLPDHPTPVRLRTHTSAPVPYFMYSSQKKADGASCFTEATAEAKNAFMPDGSKLMQSFIDYCVK